MTLNDASCLTACLLGTLGAYAIARYHYGRIRRKAVYEAIASERNSIEHRMTRECYQRL